MYLQINTNVETNNRCSILPIIFGEAPNLSVHSGIEPLIVFKLCHERLPEEGEASVAGMIYEFDGMFS